MSTITNAKAVFDSKKVVKAIAFLAISIFFGFLAFFAHNNFNSQGSNENILSYGAVIIFVGLISGLCFAEFIMQLSGKFTTAKYMLFAALVCAAEVFPLPLFRRYIPMHNYFASDSYLIKSCVYTAIIYAVTLLLAAAICHFRKKYTIKISVKENESNDNSL